MTLVYFVVKLLIMEQHYMIELDYFDPQVYEMNTFAEKEEIIVDYLRNCGKLVSLSVSNDDAIIWAVLKAESEEEVIKTINSIQVGYELSYEYYFLHHFEVVHEIGAFSLN